MKNKHNTTLSNIIKFPYLIEEGEGILYIIQELRKYRKGSKDLEKMCDALFIYEQYGIPIEVKGTQNYRNKAEQQLEQGKKYINNVLGLYVPYRKIVYYSNGLEFETI